MFHIHHLWDASPPFRHVLCVMPSFSVTSQIWAIRYEMSQPSSVRVECKGGSSSYNPLNSSKTAQEETSNVEYALTSGPGLLPLHPRRQLISDAKREGLIDIRQAPASCGERPRQTHQDPISLMTVARAPLCTAAAFIKARASLFSPPFNCSARFILTSLPACLAFTPSGR